MNRGQSYAIQLTDRNKYDGPITSTVAITFHDPSHRRVANNYWKFWLSQQKTPQAARAIDIGKVDHRQHHDFFFLLTLQHNRQCTIHWYQ